MVDSTVLKMVHSIHKGNLICCDYILSTSRKAIIYIVFCQPWLSEYIDKHTYEKYIDEIDKILILTNKVSWQNEKYHHNINMYKGKWTFI